MTNGAAMGGEQAQRVLPEWVTLWVGKAGTQKIERTNGILRGQTGKWQRRQHKFGKMWEQTEVSARLIGVISIGFGGIVGRRRPQQNELD